MEVIGDEEQTHREAAGAHERAAFLQERDAEFWDRLGDDEMATRERGVAQGERDEADLSRGRLRAAAERR